MVAEGWTRDKYVDSKQAARSYRPNGRMSASMMRAREPYRVKNAITGVLLGVFVVGIYSYSIRAVKQENFDDVDEEAKAQALRRNREFQTSVLSQADQQKAMESAAATVTAAKKS
ncbi:hypothetical protein C8J56DRAFT_1047688 [Mycena floridula]|nr:hypothetical protein C8J56DRAFT_1047688 [Mycena floridula]